MKEQMKKMIYLFLDRHREPQVIYVGILTKMLG